MNNNVANLSYELENAESDLVWYSKLERKESLL